MPLAINLASPLNRRHPLCLGLLGRWKALPGRVGGGTLFDLLGTYPAILAPLSGSSSPWVQSGRRGGAGSINTSNLVSPTVTVANTGPGSPFALLNNFTVGCWFNASQLQGNVGLMGRYQASGDNAWMIRQQSGALEFGGSTTFQTAVIFGLNAWHSVLCTIMGGGAATIYMDGISQATGAPSISVGTSSLRLGNVFNNNWNGLLDDWWVLNRAYTAAEAMAWHQETGSFTDRTLKYLQSPIFRSFPPPVPPTPFPYTAATWSGQFTDATGVFVYREFMAPDTECEIMVTGTGLSLDCYIAGSSGTSYLEYSIDGGTTWTDFTPVGSGFFNVETTIPVYSGLSDTTRTVQIRIKVAACFYLRRDGAGCFLVSGSAPAASSPSGFSGPQYIPHNTAADSIGRAGIAANSRLESGFAAVTTPNSYDAIQPATLFTAVGSGTGGVGAQLRFRATVTDLFLFTYADGSVWQLWIDGVAQPTVTAPATNHCGWVHLASGLDAAAEHLYGIACVAYLTNNVTLGSGMIQAVRAQGGTGLNTTTQPAARARLLCFGDSITANQEIDGDGSHAWPYLLGNALNMEFCNAGISSTTVHNFASNPGTLTGSAYTQATAYSGEGRPTDVTGLAPPPTKAVILYGTNDLPPNAWVPNGAPAESQADFLTSYTNMLAAQVAGLPPTTRIWCVGILPRSTFSAATMASWNALVQQAIATVSSRLVRPYVDPVPWQMNGATGTDYTTNYVDGLHPNRHGAAIIEQNLFPLLAHPVPIPSATLLGLGC